MKYLGYTMWGMAIDKFGIWLFSDVRVGVIKLDATGELVGGLFFTIFALIFFLNSKK